MLGTLLGNPHSNSSSSQTATERLETARVTVLQLFSADPSIFDIVFVANATAGIKVVQDCFQNHSQGFWYGYHADSHTSLVGVRECANFGHHCFTSDKELEGWLGRCSQWARNDGDELTDSHEKTVSTEDTLSESSSDNVSLDYSTSASSEPTRTPLTIDLEVSSAPHDNFTDNRNHLQLIAWPAQSNFDGRRLLIDRAHRCHRSDNHRTFTLLDAASLVATSPLDLSDADAAPDFTVLSFNKMFGFPDLGALIVRKESGHILQHRKYFGGGTVDTVAVIQEQWHEPKTSSIHSFLEDGTVPIHSIIALQSAIDVHKRLYGSFTHISNYTSILAQQLHRDLIDLRHFNDLPVCRIYSSFTDPTRQGPIIALNLLDSQGSFISNSEVERLASLQNIHLRTGGVCNPGGVARALNLAPWELRRNFSSGYRCGGEDDIFDGKPTGVLRLSLGAMSTASDCKAFVQFLKGYFVESEPKSYERPNKMQVSEAPCQPALAEIESLMVYPVKSCKGFAISNDVRWPVRAEGLAWDREWCIVHEGSGNVLSQKRYPRMVLIEPTLDFDLGRLRIRLNVGKTLEDSLEFSVALSADPGYLEAEAFINRDLTVCGDKVNARLYNSPLIRKLLSDFLDVPCQLARFPSSGTGKSIRHAKRQFQTLVPISDTLVFGPDQPLLLSNESPILAITRQSLTRLESDMQSGRRAKQVTDDISATVFRPNVILSSAAAPYAEDEWATLAHSGLEEDNHKPTTFEVLGPCRRCQMVCTDPETGMRRKDAEPLATLSKTRRGVGGGTWFGVHIRLKEGGSRSVRVGDRFVVTNRP